MADIQSFHFVETTRRRLMENPRGGNRIQIADQIQLSKGFLLSHFTESCLGLATKSFRKPHDDESPDDDRDLVTAPQRVPCHLAFLQPRVYVQSLARLPRESVYDGILYL